MVTNKPMREILVIVTNFIIPPIFIAWCVVVIFNNIDKMRKRKGQKLLLDIDKATDVINKMFSPVRFRLQLEQSLGSLDSYILVIIARGDEPLRFIALDIKIANEKNIIKAAKTLFNA